MATAVAGHGAAGTTRASADGKLQLPAASIDALKKVEARVSAEEARRKFTRIDAFEGAFGFMALDTLCDVGWDGEIYPSARHALLAAQRPAAAAAIAKAATTAEASEVASEEQDADDWSTRRLQVMEKIQRDKFRRSADFRKRLEETGDRELVWENDEDGFWGSVRKRGQNHLGRVLADIRNSLKDGTEFDTWLFLCCELESEAMRRPPVELLEQKAVEGGESEQKKIHRLSGRPYFKIGKIPTNPVVALHPSVSREHAMLIHTRAKVARRSHGLAIVDLGSKAGTSIGDRRLPHAFMLEPVRHGDKIRLGASTRTLTVRVNLSAQIQELEQQERNLRKEASIIDTDAANPLEAAKRAAREEATVFVGNLDYETEKADLLGLFADCGQVEEVRFPGQGASKATKGICFVVFVDAFAARRACGLHGEMFKGRRVKVAPASEGRRPGTDIDAGGKGHGQGKGETEMVASRRVVSHGGGEGRCRSPGGGGSRELRKEILSSPPPSRRRFADQRSPSSGAQRGRSARGRRVGTWEEKRPSRVRSRAPSGPSRSRRTRKRKLSSNSGRSPRARGGVPNPSSCSTSSSSSPSPSKARRKLSARG